MNCEPKSEDGHGANIPDPGRGDAHTESVVARDLTEDAFLGGRLRLRQPRRGHRAGHDAMLLAAAIAAKPGDHVVEFGCGAGAAGLAVARRIAGVRLTLIDIDPALVELARDNAALNGLQADIRVLDVGAKASAFEQAGLHPDSADHVMMNPPFNDESRHQTSPDPQRALAHVAGGDTLEGWVGAARRVLKPGGFLTAIWRAESLPDALAGLSRGFGGIAILPVYSKPDTPAIRILVAAIKGSRAPVRMQPPLYLTTADGSPAQDADRALRGGTINLPAAAAK